MINDYIKPNLNEYNNSDDLLRASEDNIFFKPNTEFCDLSRKQKIFLIGEPGYGKTRLLKELLSNSQNAIFLDLKKVGNNDIEHYISSKIDDFKIVETVDIHQISLIKTKNFQLKNSDNTLFCFDALDEVKGENLSKIIDDIKGFVTKYSKSSFIISCRKSYLSKWHHLFSGDDFSYISVCPLDQKKIEDFLKPFGIGEQEIKNLIKRVPFTILRTPRYLEMLAKLVQKDGVDKVMNISRTELFDKFIYHKL